MTTDEPESDDGELAQSKVAGTIRHLLFQLPAEARVTVEVQQADGTIRTARVTNVQRHGTKKDGRVILRVREQD